jgi:hypothetical protein
VRERGTEINGESEREEREREREREREGEKIERTANKGQTNEVRAGPKA